MKFKIPLFKLNYGIEEEEAVLETIRSKWISMGPKCNEFEELFSKMLDAKFAVSLSNCTSALHLSLQLTDIKEGDEVIVPSLTFAATVNAIRYVKAIPVFCDIKSYEDLTVDPESVESLTTSKTKAIIVMHYAGFPCDMDRIMQHANKHGLKVIEDACHGPLSDYKGKKLGTIGDTGCFSFFSNKNISTGEGGMLVTNNEEIYNLTKLYRSHGMTTMSYERSKGHSTSYDVIELGYNYRLDDIRASLGIAQLKKLEADLKKRTVIREQYLNRIGKIGDVIIPFMEHKGFVSNYIFPIVLVKSNSHKRDEVRETLAANGIQTSVHYPAVHRFSIYEKFKVELPISEYVADNLITLPMYSSLSELEIDYICSVLERSLTS